MKNNETIKWEALASFVYLNTSFLIFFLFLYTFIEDYLASSDFVLHLSVFLFAPIVLGLVVDYINRNKRVVFLRYYLKVVNVVFLIIFFYFFIFLLFPAFQSVESAIFAIVVLFVLFNLFYTPVNAYFDFLTPAKQLPFILAIVVCSTYSIFLLKNDIYEYLFSRLGLWVFLLLMVVTVHAGYVFRNHIKKLELNYAKEDFKKTSWNKIIWMALLLGVGHVSLLHLYPKFYLMINEPHGVSKEEAQLFGELVFFAAIVLLLPLGILVSRVGVSKFIKTNNTILVLSILAAIFFPAYFYVAATMSTISLSLAIITNLPVAYYHLSNKHRAVGVGLFFSIVFSLVLVAEYFLGEI